MAKKNATITQIEGYSPCINYTSYDYLGLCNESMIIEATGEAIKEVNEERKLKRAARKESDEESEEE